MRYVWIALVAAFGLTGCSEGAFAPRPPSQTLPAVAPRAASDDLYVANLFGNDVTVYDLQTGALVRTIAQGVKAPTAVKIGPDRNIYVANAPCCKPQGGGFVSVFAPGATKPLRTIRGLNDPNALTFDSKGDLYVVDALGGSTQNGEIDVYAPGGTTVVRRIDQGLAQPVVAVVDASGTLYVDNVGFNQGSPVVDGSVTVYPASASAPSVTLQSSNPGPVWIALDSHDQLYVAGGSSINIYSAGGASLIHSIALSSSAYVSFLAFDKGGNLYASTLTSISVYGRHLRRSRRSRQTQPVRARWLSTLRAISTRRICRRTRPVILRSTRADRGSSSRRSTAGSITPFQLPSVVEGRHATSRAR